MKQLILTRGVNKMNFKKLVCLTIAFALAFAPVVGAAEGDDVCVSCQGKDVRKDNLKWEVVGDQDSCSPISYEHQEYIAPGGTKTRWGYMSDSQDINSKLIVQICNCPLANQKYFDVGKIVGIRLSILDPGVYWTNEELAIQPFASKEAACRAGVGLPGGVTVDQNDGIGPENVAGVPTSQTPNELNAITALPNVRYDAYGNVDTSRSGTDTTKYIFMPPVKIKKNAIIPSEGYDIPMVWSYGSATGWSGVSEPTGNPHSRTDRVVGLPTKPDQVVRYTYYKETAMNNIVTSPLPPSTSIANCEVPDARRATVIEVKGAYQFGPLDVRQELVYWWVDLPQMVKDHRLVKRGDVRIKIELLSSDVQGVCADCKTICECEFLIGTFPEDVASTTSIYFPYVFTAVPGWGTGIVITNMDTVSTSIADMEATFTLTDSMGDKFTYKKTDFESEGNAVYSFMLDGIIDRFTGGTPKAGNGWLKVETNFMVDGYEFVNNDNFGAGTLPRR